MEIGVLLLAAGASRRMGTAKCLLPWDEGTVLDSVCRALASASPVKVAVIPPHPLLAAIVASHGFRAVVNTAEASLQSDSLRLGLGAMPATCDALLCAVGDQPALTETTVQRLCGDFQRWHKRQGDGVVVRPQYGDHGGNPVIWGRRWFPYLRAVTGDQGGRLVLPLVPAAWVHTVDAPSWEGEDVDTWASYVQLKRVLRSMK